MIRCMVIASLSGVTSSILLVLWNVSSCCLLLSNDRDAREPLPEGWDSIPGARGCNPQTCNFRGHYKELSELRSRSWIARSKDCISTRDGRSPPLSTRDPERQDFKLCDSLRQPTFEIAGMRLAKGRRLITLDGRMGEVFDPVFPLTRAPIKCRAGSGIT
jgi:hypothetical protein